MMQGDRPIVIPELAEIGQYLVEIYFGANCYFHEERAVKVNFVTKYT